MGGTLVTSLDTAKIYQKIFKEKDVNKTVKQIAKAHDKGEASFKERFTKVELMSMGLEEFYGEWNLEVLKHLKIKDAKLARYIHERWLKAAELEVFEDTRPVLHRLSAMGVYVGIVTNGFIAEVEEVMDITGLKPEMFSIIVGRDTTGAEKPDPRPFLHAVGSFGLKPDEVVFVGDKFAKDYEGAQGAGMVPILLLRGKFPPKEAPKDINTIETLDEVIKFIQ